MKPPPRLFVSSTFSRCPRNPRVLWLNRRLARPSSFVYAETPRLGSKLGPVTWYVGTPRSCNSSVDCSPHFLHSGFNTWFLSSKRTERSSPRSGGAKSSGEDEDASRHDISLVNNHNSSLPSFNLQTPDDFDGDSGRNSSTATP